MVGAHGLYAFRTGGELALTLLSVRLLAPASWHMARSYLTLLLQFTALFIHCKHFTVQYNAIGTLTQPSTRSFHPTLTLPVWHLPYLTLPHTTRHLLHPGCSSPPPSELLPHRTCLPCGLGPLVFNNAIVPSSFSDPLLIPFRSSTTNPFVFTSQHHVRYPPHPPHLSQLS
jgi:hypothetical protein